MTSFGKFLLTEHSIFQFVIFFFLVKIHLEIEYSVSKYFPKLVIYFGVWKVFSDEFSGLLAVFLGCKRPSCNCNQREARWKLVIFQEMIQCRQEFSVCQVASCSKNYHDARLVSAWHCHFYP